MRYICGSASRKSLLTAFLLIGVFAGLVLRFVDLGGKSLWTDEMLTLQNALLDDHLTAAHIFGNLHGPLISILLHFWGGLSRVEGFLRLPFAVAGALTVLSMYALSKSVSGSWISLNTAFFVSLSPMLIWYSQEVRGYAFVVLFSVLMTYYLVRWTGSRNKRDLFLYGLFLFAGLLSNLSAAFVAFGHFAYLIAFPAKRRLLGRWVVSVFVVLLLFSPWVRSILVRAHVERVIGGDVGDPLVGGGKFSGLALPYSFFTYSVGYTFGPALRAIQTGGLREVMRNLHWVIAALVFFAAPVVVGLRKLKRENTDLLWLLLMWMAIPLAAVSILSIRNVKVFTPRYALVSLPPYALIVGRGLAAITKSRWWPVTIIFAALLGVSLYNYFLEPAYGKDDARGVARTIKEHFEDGDRVVAIYASRPLIHYLRGFTDVNIFEAKDMESRQTIAARCEHIAEASERIWLSLCREWLADPDGVIHTWFGDNMDLIRSFEFTGMRLYLYGKRST